MTFTSPQAPQVNTTTSGYQSPPIMLSRDHGRHLNVWINNGLSDDVSVTTLEARVFATGSISATADIHPSASAVDGTVDRNNGFAETLMHRPQGGPLNKRFASLGRKSRVQARLLEI